MTFKILYSLLLLTFVVVPFFYKSARPSMLAFYRRMTVSDAWRVMYTRMLVLFLLAFHFCHLSLFHCQYDLVPSSILCLLLCRHSFFERTLRFLQQERALWSAMILSLSCLFIPHFLPLGVTMGVLAFGTVYYPSKYARGFLLYWKVLESGGEEEEPGFLYADWYFTWRLKVHGGIDEQFDEESLAFIEVITSKYEEETSLQAESDCKESAKEKCIEDGEEISVGVGDGQPKI